MSSNRSFSSVVIVKPRFEKDTRDDSNNTNGSHTDTVSPGVLLRPHNVSVVFSLSKKTVQRLSFFLSLFLPPFFFPSCSLPSFLGSSLQGV